MDKQQKYVKEKVERRQVQNLENIDNEQQNNGSEATLEG